MLKRDNLKLGLIMGLVAPLLVFILIYYVRFSSYTIPEFFRVLPEEDKLITFCGVWCLVANIALFTIYTNTNRHLTARGIFVISVVYGILILLLKTLN